MPTQDHKGHWKYSGQGASWKLLCFFREIQIIKEDIILGSSVIYLLEFVLQAVLYGKCLPKVSIDVFCWMFRATNAQGATENLPLFLLEQGHYFQNLKLLTSS